MHPVVRANRFESSGTAGCLPSAAALLVASALLASERRRTTRCEQQAAAQEEQDDEEDTMWDAMLASGQVKIEEHKPPPPLHLAAASGNLAEVNAILSAGVDLTSKDSEEMTALMAAVRFQRDDVTAAILDYADNEALMAVDKEGWTALHWACQVGGATAAERLVSMGPDLLGCRDRRGLTPLHVASWRGNAVIADLLLKAGANPGACTIFGETPLHQAVYFGHTAAVEVLVRGGADVNAEDRSRRTPIGLASQNKELTAKLESLSKSSA
jgi:ankyrin repeat/protein kinase domain-containing protein 1